LPALEEIFARAAGRVLVCCFATSLPRMQRVVDVAAAHGRRMAFVGRRMAENADVAQQLGLLRLPEDAVVSPEAAAALPPERVALLVSGSQGEPLSGLSLISVGEQRDIRVGPSDVAIHSARVIPGNDRAVGRVFDNLHRRGCEVVHSGLALVHVSGHGGRDDLATMLKLVRPRHFIPIHGEYRMLARHARLAVETGLPAERVLLVEDGETVSLTAEQARLGERVSSGRVLLDRSSADGVDEGVVKDRRHLSSNGIVVPIIVLEKESGRLGSQPEIVTRGLSEPGSEISEEAARRILQTIETRTPEEFRDPSLMRERVRLDLIRFYKRRTQRRPLVVPVVMEV
jgi:ribonuclease J